MMIPLRDNSIISVRVNDNAWPIMRCALRLPIEIFEGSGAIALFGRYGWKAISGGGVKLVECIASLEAARKDGVIPCNHWLHLGDLAAMHAASDNKGGLISADKDMLDVEPVPVKESLSILGSFREKDLALFSSLVDMVCLRKRMVQSYIIAMTAFECFLRAGPAIYSALASPGIAPALWAYLHHFAGERDLTVPGIKSGEFSTMIMLPLRSQCMEKDKELAKLMDEVRGLFEDQVRINEKMKIAVKERALLRNSSGSELI